MEAAKSGHANVASFFLAPGLGRQQPSTLGMLRFTAAHFAARDGHGNVIEVLTRHGADFNLPSLSQDRPLHLAARNGHFRVCSLLIHGGANPHLRNIAFQKPSDVVPPGNHQLLALFAEAERLY